LWRKSQPLNYCDSTIKHSGPADPARFFANRWNPAYCTLEPIQKQGTTGVGAKMKF
jgi:hypothetical protein